MTKSKRAGQNHLVRLDLFLDIIENRPAYYIVTVLQRPAEQQHAWQWDIRARAAHILVARAPRRTCVPRRHLTATLLLRRKAQLKRRLAHTVILEYFNMKE